MSVTPAWLAEVCWNDSGLLPAIAQDSVSGRILMMAWMNQDALVQSVEGGYAVYWSRSRKILWHKGERSGNRQRIVSVSLDCDGDTLLLEVVQEGGVACHTGRESCFFRRLDDDGRWGLTEPVLTMPEDLYGDSNE